MKIDNFLNNEFYRAIEKAYEYNYVCRFVENQIKQPNNGDKIFLSADIFDRQNSSKQNYLDRKLEGYALQRNRFFSVVLKAFEEETIDEELNNIKNAVIEKFNAYYKTNKNFEDVFDKDSIIDQTLYDSFYMINNNTDTSKEFEELAMTVSSYIHAFSKYKNYVTARDILDTLNNDINASGYKSLYYGIPKSKEVYKLDGDTLDDITNFVLKESSQKLKKSYKLEKYFKKQEQPDTQSDEFNEYTNLSSDIIILQILSIYLTALNDRYVSATKPDFKKLDLLKTKLADLSSGINPFKKNKITDFIYIHKIELDDIFNLLLSLDNTEDFVKKLSENTGYVLENQQFDEFTKEQ